MQNKTASYVELGIKGDTSCCRRCGSGDTKVSFTLELNSQPQLCDLSPQLAGFMGCRQHVKGAVLQSLLAHIRMHNLQVPPPPAPNPPPPPCA